jgi:2-polyprenyl-6-methoxyphenol hydroxylase-like FAD-dependent oxidoreductase
MSMKPYDAIVIGARCAGSPAAMLLARKGYKVLLVDKAKFPSDTISTHVIVPRGAAALQRWGLLDRVKATGCPPIHTYTFDFGPLKIAGSPGTADSPNAYCPRRTLLDKILVDAAVESGVELREEFSVDEVTMSDGRVTGIKGHAKNSTPVTETARVVIGADGLNSIVSKTVKPEQYNEKPALQGSYYSYFADLPTDGRFEICIGMDHGFAAAETNDGLTMVVGGWPIADYETKKKNHEANWIGMLESEPGFGDRVRGARRAAKIYGAATPNYFRKPYGEGWALIGDAGYRKDPITAQGIANAFLDAERCSRALDASFSGAQSYGEAMSAYQRERDEDSMGMYEMTCQLAAFAPPPPEMLQLIGAMQGNQKAMDAFAQMNAGTLSPERFFAPEHIGSIMAAAAGHS